MHNLIFCPNRNYPKNSGLKRKISTKKGSALLFDEGLKCDLNGPLKWNWSHEIEHDFRKNEMSKIQRKLFMNRSLFYKLNLCHISVHFNPKKNFLRNNICLANIYILILIYFFPDDYLWTLNFLANAIIKETG